MITEEPIFVGLRKTLVNELRKNGIEDENVLSAIGTVPRQLFADKSYARKVYSMEQPIPIAAGQTLSQPYTVAIQSSLLQINKGDKVLEIGTGSGYQAAVLYQMGAEVYSIERQEVLYKSTSRLLQKLGYAIHTFYGDGYKGLVEHAPFDKIIITCGAPNIPVALLQQLKVGGMMVIPLGEIEQTMNTVLRQTEVDFEKKEYGKFRFVPMLKDCSEAEK